jgi:hypothetical protein
MKYEKIQIRINKLKNKKLWQLAKVAGNFKINSPIGREGRRFSFMLSFCKYLARENIPYGILNKREYSV